jgi:hypothetical protein
MRLDVPTENRARYPGQQYGQLPTHEYVTGSNATAHGLPGYAEYIHNESNKISLTKLQSKAIQYLCATVGTPLLQGLGDVFYMGHGHVTVKAYIKSLTCYIV